MRVILRCPNCGEYETDENTAQTLAQPFLETAKERIQASPKEYAGLGIEVAPGCLKCYPGPQQF